MHVSGKILKPQTLKPIICGEGERHLPGVNVHNTYRRGRGGGMNFIVGHGGYYFGSYVWVYFQKFKALHLSDCFIFEGTQILL
jgi:hypothetical protein